MLKVKIFLKELELGCLTVRDEGYVYAANKVAINSAFKKYPIEMRRYTLPQSGNSLYKCVPPIFSEFLEYTNRADLMERVGINVLDAAIEKIYKLAGLDMMSTVFIIKQG